jgi:hypothetical protein
MWTHRKPYCRSNAFKSIPSRCVAGTVEDFARIVNVYSSAIAGKLPLLNEEKSNVETAASAVFDVSCSFYWDPQYWDLSIGICVPFW